MEEEEIDVGTYNDANPEPAAVDFQCEICKFVGKSERSLSAHKRHNHPDLVKPKETPTRGRGRPRKQEFEDDSQGVVPQRVTTKELLGGRKRPKTFVDSVNDDSALRTNQEASRLHSLGLVDAETPIGDYLRRGDRYALMSDDMDPEDMVVGEEVVIGETEHDMMTPAQQQRRFGPVRRRFGDKLPARITTGDPEGKYKCYVEDCPWRGGYRSLRMDHMRAIHPDWKMPSRYLLERISKDNIYIDPKDHKPQFECPVEGCEWSGNYRASRSSHMRKMHPEEHAAKKKNAPGYGSNGTYSCHYPACTWRGWSRSTRSSHLKRVHPDWRPEDNRILIVLSCFHCKSVFNSYPALCEHIASHGGVGAHVDESFESRDEFARWMHRIEGLYNITFERHDPLQSGEFPELNDSHFYYLHCNVIGSRGCQLANDARAYIHSTHGYLKRRPHQLMTRQKNDCSAYLEVREDPHYGTINVKGTLEHTGHRFGTPLLRMLAAERELFCEILNWNGDEETHEIMGMDMLDKMIAGEGFGMENFGPPEELNLMEPLHEDQILSLRQLISQSDQECFFAVRFDDVDPRKMRFGYQNLEMQKYWGRYAPDGYVVIDTILLDFHNLALFQYTVMVVDEHNVPKCAMLYLTSDQEGSPEIILERLVQLDPREPKVFLLDSSEVWVPLMEKYYGGDDPEKPRPLPEIMISEWALMDYWTCKVQQYTDNEIDVFCITAALRRALRYDDPFQLHSFFVELFEAFYETGYDSLAQFFDAQLCDMEYLKRWSPFRRQGLTSHLHPLLNTASRVLRAQYLGLEDIGRVDQWFAHATKRIEDFNSVETSSPFTSKQIELPRKYLYGLMTLDGQQIIQNPHLRPAPQNPEDEIIYEDGEEVEEVVVGEEVIGHVNAEGEEIIYEEVIQEEFPASEAPETEKKEKEKIPGEKGTKEESTIGEEDAERDLVQQQRRPPPAQPRRIPPHRLPVQATSQPPPAPAGPPPPPPTRTRRSRGASNRVESESDVPGTSTAPARARRETTKSVVRNRRKKDRFASLRDVPPELMRAIAAHAIAYDGRKKEQRPFQFVPSPARMARGTRPEEPTPDLSQFEVPSMRTIMGQQHMQRQRVQQQQQRREAMRRAQQQRWEEDEMNQRPSTSSNPNLHPGHPLHHPRQNLGPRGTFIPPHRLPPGTHRARQVYHEQYMDRQRRRPMYSGGEDVDVNVVEEIEEVVQVVEEEEIDVGTHDEYYEEMYQEGEYGPEGADVVVEHEGVIEEVIEEVEEAVDGDQQPCTSASLYR